MEVCPCLVVDLCGPDGLFGPEVSLPNIRLSSSIGHLSVPLPHPPFPLLSVPSGLINNLDSFPSDTKSSSDYLCVHRFGVGTESGRNRNPVLIDRSGSSISFGSFDSFI